MAQITGQAGTNLSQQLATYLSVNQGNLTSEEITAILNSYLTGGDKVASQGGSINIGIYKRFGEFDQITGKTEVVTTGLWSGDTGSLTTFFTSSTQPAQDYYVDVYDASPLTTGTVQMAIAYGHKTGGGSQALSVNDESTLATKATYSQYRSILLDQDDDTFTFTSSTGAGVVDSDDIYVVNIARARYKESMDPGNFSFTIGAHTYIDDSGKKFDDTVGKAGRVFNIVEGNLNLGTESAATITNNYAPNGEGFGLFYPDLGILVFNPSALASKTSIGAPVTTTTAEQRNHLLLYEGLKAGADSQARRTENISTAHYFVRATNREFNFSNNPTFTTGSDGTFAESSFVNDPKTYITTVGLYSDANELLAVAKTSQPIPKSFDKEVLIKVKLSF